MECQTVRFSQKGDDRGSLIVIESNKEVPFNIERVFYMLNTTKDTIRGQHANRFSEFVLVNVKGSVTLVTHDGSNEKTIVLDKPDVGLYVPKMVWKDMRDFSEDSILLVLSNLPYQENEYIRDFDAFIKEVNHG